MARKRLFWRIYLHYLFVIVLSLTLALLFATWALRDFTIGRVKADLEARALLVANQVHEGLSHPREELNELCRQLGTKSDTRITVILPSGKVVADSRKNPVEMDNHADRPEIRAAFQGKTGTRIRYSHTLGKKMVYVAVPIADQGKIVCTLRTSMPIASVGQVC